MVFLLVWGGGGLGCSLVLWGFVWGFLEFGCFLFFGFFFLILSLCILLFYGPGAWSVMSHNCQANLLIS